MKTLDRAFYLRDTLTVARDLLGKLLVHETPEGRTVGRIVETEAYLGPRDKAAHSYRAARGGRTEIQYGPGGYAYLYLIYGIHYCMNIVTGPPECPEVVLLRALEPAEGLELMAKRRKTETRTALCSGPGKLCAAMALDKSCYGADLCGDTLYLLDDGTRYGEDEIAATPRIGIDYAEEARDFPWRFLVRDSQYISVKPRQNRE